MGIRDKFRRALSEAPVSSRDVWVVVGIGNPGSQYAGNRHNVGAWAVNRLAKELGLELKNSKMAGLADGLVDDHRLLLVRPRTFVNESGRAVGEILRRHGIPLERLVVIYDDLDLPPGQVRIRPKGSHGGHNGMRSIIGAIGSGDFPRIRVGVGRPAPAGVPSWDPDDVAAYVLGNPPPSERELLESGAAKAADAALTIVRSGVEAAMNAYNRDRREGSQPAGTGTPAGS